MESVVKLVTSVAPLLWMTLLALTINYQLSTINYQLSTIMKKELWQKILHFVITVLTAIATTLGTTSCIEAM